MRARLVLSLLVALSAACATAGTLPEESTDDAGASTAKGDAGSSAEAGCPKGKTGPSCSLCATGYHGCGGGNCVQDQPNTPDAGCSSSCGSACPTPTHGSATCTSAGHCDFECAPTWAKADAGCECEPGKNACPDGTCAECCSDSDCPAHTKCSSGTCGGCDTNWADCNKNPSDGCETSLSSEPNCGSCGRSCSGYPACGVFTFHGESCKASGGGYACKC